MSSKKIQVHTIAEDFDSDSETGPADLSLSPTTAAKVQTWAARQGLEDSQAEELAGQVREWCQEEVGSFCEGFGDDAASLALLIHSICGLYAEMSEQGEAESLTLQGEALEQLHELALNVLRYIDTTNANVDLIDVDSLN